MREHNWRRRLEESIENSRDGELTLDSEARITFANDRAAKLLGRDRSALIGMAYKEASAGAVVSVNSRPVRDETGVVKQTILTLRETGGPDFTLINDSLAQSVFLVKDHRIEYVNEAAARLLKSPAEKIAGTRMEEWLGAELGNRFERAADLVHYVDQSVTVEGIAAAGSEDIWASLTISPVWDFGGRPDGIVATALDISDKKLVEDSLRDSEDMFRSILSSATAIIIVLSPDYRIREFNAQAERFFGASRNDVIGRDYFELFLNAGSWAETGLDERRAMTGVTNAAYENAVIDSFGRQRTISWQVNPLIDNEGSVRGTVVIGQDVTERKRVEEALKESENRHQTLFKECPVALWEGDLSGVKRYIDRLMDEGIIAWRKYFQEHPEAAGYCAGLVKVTGANRAALEMFQAPNIKAFIEGFPLVMGPAPETGWCHQIMALARGERKYEGEAGIVTLRGEKRAISVLLLVADGYENNLERVIVSMIDITRQRKEKTLSDSLVELSTIFTSHLDTERIEREAVKKGAAALGCDAAAILLFSQGKWSIDQSYGIETARCDKLLSGKAEIFADIENGGPGHELFACLGLTAHAIKLLATGGKTFGAILFGNRRPDREFDEPEINFIKSLAVSLALGIENSRHYQAEIETSTMLQETILAIPESVDGLVFNCLYKSSSATAQVGGDFYDIFELGPRQAGIVVGDVSGKGLKAATTTSLVRTTLRAYAYQNASPAQVMRLTNQAVMRAIPESIFVTLFFGVIDKTNGVLTYCGAGHPPALIRRSADGKVLPLDSHSPPIGIFNDMYFNDLAVRIGRDDTLFLYTDGVIEARCNSELFGQERLIETITGIDPKTEEAPEKIFERVCDYSGKELGDDVVILCVELAQKNAGTLIDSKR